MNWSLAKHLSRRRSAGMLAAVFLLMAGIRAAQADDRPPILVAPGEQIPEELNDPDLWQQWLERRIAENNEKRRRQGKPEFTLPRCYSNAARVCKEQYEAFRKEHGGTGVFWPAFFVQACHETGFFEYRGDVPSVDPRTDAPTYNVLGIGVPLKEVALAEREGRAPGDAFDDLPQGMKAGMQYIGIYGGLEIDRTEIESPYLKENYDTVVAKIKKFKDDNPGHRSTFVDLGARHWLEVGDYVRVPKEKKSVPVEIDEAAGPGTASVRAPFFPEGERKYKVVGIDETKGLVLIEAPISAPGATQQAWIDLDELEPKTQYPDVERKALQYTGSDTDYGPKFLNHFTEASQWVAEAWRIRKAFVLDAMGEDTGPDRENDVLTMVPTTPGPDLLDALGEDTGPDPQRGTEPEGAPPDRQGVPVNLGEGIGPDRDEGTQEGETRPDENRGSVGLRPGAPPVRAGEGTGMSGTDSPTTPDDEPSPEQPQPEVQVEPFYAIYGTHPVTWPKPPQFESADEAQTWLSKVSTRDVKVSARASGKIAFLVTGEILQDLAEHRRQGRADVQGPGETDLYQYFRPRRYHQMLHILAPQIGHVQYPMFLSFIDVAKEPPADLTGVDIGLGIRLPPVVGELSEWQAAGAWSRKYDREGVGITVKADGLGIGGARQWHSAAKQAGLNFYKQVFEIGIAAGTAFDGMGEGLGGGFF